ncbi:MAG: dipeptidase [Paracoccaceae bacterium]
MIPVFDGHNDLLYRLNAAPEARQAIWDGTDTRGHLDLPRIRTSGFKGGFFAVYIPSPDAFDAPDILAQMDNPPYDFPLPDLIDHRTAQPIALAQIGHLKWLERTGTLQICTTTAQIRATMATDKTAAILHFEGAEAIDPNLDALHTFHAMGLRSIGPVWSRPTIFGHGVPFRFPATPDTGPGLTDLGKRLVKECNALHIMLDLSHLNEQGFNDVASLSDAPLVATHSNAHAICPTSRNLTDRQLAMIKDSQGMVGLNFATCFLRPDGHESADMPLDPMLHHLDHLITALGEDHVGFGSDFDGATMPKDIKDVTGLPTLLDALKTHGYTDALLHKLAHQNWLSLLDRTWSA